MEIIKHQLSKQRTGYVVPSGPESGATLVRRDPKSKDWKPVDRLDRSIGDLELSNSYGLWRDKEKTSGALFWKQVERPADGKVQNDEVKSFRDAKDHTLMTDLESGDPTYLTRDKFQVKLQETRNGTLVVLEERWRERRP